MSDDLKCLRCGSEMEIVKNQILRIGEPEMLMLRRVPGGIEVDVHQCLNCGKLEFYHHKDELITKIKCPSCGEVHDKDYPKCPYCKHDYGRK